jgi:hypothetical protein
MKSRRHVARGAARPCIDRRGKRFRGMTNAASVSFDMIRRAPALGQRAGARTHLITAPNHKGSPMLTPRRRPLWLVRGVRRAAVRVLVRVAPQVTSNRSRAVLENSVRVPHSGWSMLALLRTKQSDALRAFFALRDQPVQSSSALSSRLYHANSPPVADSVRVLALELPTSHLVVDPAEFERSHRARVLEPKP